MRLYSSADMQEQALANASDIVGPACPSCGRTLHPASVSSLMWRCKEGHRWTERALREVYN